MAYGACEPGKAGYAARIGYILDGEGKVKKAYPKVDAKTFPETALKDL